MVGCSRKIAANAGDHILSPERKKIPAIRHQGFQHIPGQSGEERIRRAPGNPLGMNPVVGFHPILG